MSGDDNTRTDIISTVDNVIEKIQNLRKIMLGVSISAVILAPFAIGLSIYLFIHPSFYSILEQKEDFGLFLGIMLAGIILISAIWLVTGIRQYMLLSNWNHRYCGYLKKKKDLDSQIVTEFHLGKD
ncbi:MAG: hypothetical protein ACE5DL_02425 [Nitrosopumilaceae archaeon]